MVLNEMRYKRKCREKKENEQRNVILVSKAKTNGENASKIGKGGNDIKRVDFKGIAGKNYGYASGASGIVVDLHLENVKGE